MGRFRIKYSDIIDALYGVLIVVIAAVTIAVGSLIVYYRVRTIVEKNAYRQAQDNIDQVEKDFTRVAELVECAVRNNLWSAAVVVSQPDSLWALTRGIVKDNPVIFGSAMAMVEGNFSPYAYRKGDEIISTQLATPEYDYKHQEWFVEGLKADESGYWSEPYFDEGGGNMLMITYSVPVRNHRGELAAVITSDVSLDWLSDRLVSIEDYPYALCMLVTRSGSIMATSPPNVGLTGKNIVSLAESMTDGADFIAVNRSMLAGEEGAKVVSLNGKKYHVFYDRIKRTGWSMSLSIPEEDIFAEVDTLNRRVLGVQLVGIVMLAIILLMTVINQRRLMRVNEKKNRIDSELKVARGIQMAMVPKLFPPYPERKDIDLFACLIPAKEVGGDLYDFFIRDERLYFCVGDVSGKGVPASLVMSVTRSLFRTVSGHEKSPLRIVSTINENLVEMNESDMFVTFFCGVLDLQTGHLRYCNAGHNAPVLLTAEGPVLLSVVPNLPLGVLSHMSFVEQESDLQCGAGLFLYTDGLTEAENEEHALFGEKRMMKALKPDATSTEMIDIMTRAVRGFVNEAPQSDDLTMLHIRYMNDTPMEKTERHLILHNDIQQIPQLAEFVETVGGLAHLGNSVIMSLNLALEEAVTNVILYAYPEGADGLVDVEAIIRKDEVQFIVTDSGRPFDPTAAPEADITLAAEDRPIGGLGILLVRNIMDSVRYDRIDGKNVLTMSKNLL